MFTDFSSTSTLGRDLPDTEEALFALKPLPLLNQEEGLANCGSEALLMELLHLLIEKELPTEKERLEEAYQNGNFQLVETLSHKLKSSAIYCGTTKLKIACQYLERSIKAGLSHLQDKLYSQLICVIDETADAVRAKLNGKP